jgi:amidase
MGKWDELAYMDAMAQAELVRKGDVKPVELVEAAIERIESVNPKLNAVVTEMFEEGRRAAESGLPEGPFMGVPFLLKDLLAQYKGVRYTSGSRFLKDNISPLDTELVSRYKRAGLVIIGKTNTPEFGILPTTEPQLFGPTRNPWDPERTAGGSSGGSAAAVASCMVPMAHGNDGGGSIRIPASCCGVFGLKPTRARNPLGPLFGDLMGGLVVEHALTRSVRDSAALLDATSGPDVGDPYWAPPPKGPFLSEVGRDPSRLRIGFLTKAPTGVTVHQECVRAVEDAARLCEGLGHLVEEVSLNVDGELVTRNFMVLWSTGCTWTLEAWSRTISRDLSPDHFEPLTWALYEMGKQYSASDYIKAVHELQLISRLVSRVFLEYDVVITPTLGEPPVPLGSFDSPPDSPMKGMARAGEFVPFTPICNVTGQPAMSVPLYWDNEGLPVGTHFIGRFGEEATLFRLASQLEAERPWAQRRPPICA